MRPHPLLLWSLLLGACTGPGEAEDPGAFLAEMRLADEREEAAPRNVEPADSALCRSAALRVEELALEIVVLEETDPAERNKLEARAREDRKGPEFRARVEEGTEQCLGRDTSAAEARCISRVKSAQDLDACVE